ncbi:MAG TPA: kelch repeat-containing protein, partial [Gemmatimonadales bacterium]|nr:kelch repeat-containing protein [Gemmatimonadales bacterium]
AIGVVNGILYAVGGVDGAGATGTVEAYDPATNTWTAKAPMPTPRSQLAVGVVNGILYALGGFPAGGGAFNTALNTVEAYDPITNSWTTKSPLPTSRASLSVGAVNGILYGVGGESGGSVTVNVVEAYSPSTNLWTTKTPMLGGSRAFGFAAAVNGVIYVIGGNDGSSIVGDAESYVP